jgi:O-antigen ligase
LQNFFLDKSENPINLKYLIGFIIFIAPITISISGDGTSSNYLFLILLFLGKYKYNSVALIYVLFLTLSLTIGIILYSKFDYYFILRQFVSYFVMVSGVFLLFININNYYKELKLAILISSIFYSLTAIYLIISNGFLTSDIYFIRAGLQQYLTDWPQRYVIVLMFALFISIEGWSRSFFWPIVTVVLSICIFFTFTRASWIGIIFGFISLFFTKKKSEIKPTKSSRFTLFVSFIILLITIIFISRNEFAQIGFQTFYDNIEIITNTNPKDFDSESSEGERFVLWETVLNVVKSNFISGTGFAGIHLFTKENGSTHNQYVDILLRTGVVGLIFYFYFCLRTLFFYKKFDPYIFSGLVSIFVMGFFHETTKLSYGGFIFFMLCNISFEKFKFKNKNKSII